MNGLGVGILSGLLVSGVVLTAMSLSTPLPPRPGADAVPELDVTMGADGAETDAPSTGSVVEEDATAADAPVEDATAEDAAPVEADAAADTDEADATQGEDAATAPEASTAPDAVDPVEDPAPQVELPAGNSAEDAAPEAPTGSDPAPDAEATPDAEETGAAAPATDIPLPSGSEFNRPPPEEAAALPATDTAPTAAAPSVPQLARPSQSPSFDTAPAAQPQVTADAPAAIGAAPVLGAAPEAPSGSSAVAASSDGPTELAQPQVSATPSVETATAPLPEAEPQTVPSEDAATDIGTELEPGPAESVAETDAVTPVDDPDIEATPGEEAEVLPTEDIAALDAVEPEAPELQAPRFPTIGDDIGSEDDTAPAEDPSDTTTPRFPQISRLPQAGIGNSADPAEAETEAEAGTEADAAAQTTPDDLPAIQAFAADFDASEDRPLMAVVLIDEPESRIELSTLTRFTFPVAFAIDPLHPDAAARAATYRDAGFEVVMLGSMLPEGATAMDTEVAVSAAQSVLPEAVALMDTPDSRIQGDRPVLDATVGLLAETGHGLVAFPRGLNAAEQTASRAGVPGATLFRLLDDENQRATMITRFLSRAAFTAAQEGTVIVAGHTRPDTVTALFSWALGDRSEGVALAPLSATLLRAASD